MTEKDKMKRISEYFGEQMKGMSGTNKSMTFVFDNKEIVIENYGSKSVEEIIKEIEGLMM